MTTRIKLRRDTAANWATSNPVLALGEPGYDTTNNELRVGDGTTAWATLDSISGGALSGTVITDTLISSLQSGLPDWLEWNTRGGTYTEGADFGADQDGVWFANSQQAGGSGTSTGQGGEGTVHAYAMPLQTTFSLANTAPCTVTVEFLHGSWQDDHAFGFHLASANPVLTWNTGAGGIANQVMFQVDAGRPQIWYDEDFNQWDSNLDEDKVYRVVFEFNGTNVVVDIYDQDGIRHDDITQDISIPAFTGDYAISFGADNDNESNRSYYRNLKISLNDQIEVSESVRFTANAQISLPGDMLIGNFRDEDYVVWAPEHAEYVGLWYGGDRGGDVFTQDGYGPNVSVQVGRVEADDANQQFSDVVPTSITTGNNASRSAEGITMYARDQGWVFHENGNIYLPPGGTIRNEYDVDVLAGSQGVISDWSDGINDNVWRIVPMSGTKAFDYDTPGWKEVVMTWGGSTVTTTGITITIADYPALQEFFTMTSAPYSTSWSMYIGEDYGTQLTTPSYVIDGSGVDFSFDSATLTSGSKIVVKYYTEGTTYTDSYYNDWNGIIPSQTALSTNTFTVLTTEFGAPWSDFLANATSSSVTFKSWNSQIVRDVVAVNDLGSDIYEVEFSGAPVDVKTITLETINNAVVTNTGVGSSYLYISQTSYPDFGKYCRLGWMSTNTNQYTGGTGRSGYVIIDGGEPINFVFYGNAESTTGDYQLELTTNATWTPSSSVQVNWYREECRIQLNVYVGNAGSWNNGFKWLDWKEDYTELSPAPGNGIVAGQGIVTMKAYIPESQDSVLTNSNFAWSGIGYNNQEPYDPYRQQNILNLSENNCVPFDEFDERGVVFSSSYNRNGYSVRLKVRIIYKFELTIGEDYYQWWC